jgi:quercetin dioxygenase-like cupin family protein
MDTHAASQRLDPPQAEQMPAQLRALLVGGAASGGRFALLELVERQGHELPLHRHHWEDEVLYVLDGRIAVCIDGAWHVAGVGASLVVPRQREHAVAVVSGSARLLVFLTPAGFEHFYLDMQRAAADSAAAAQLERLVATAARYGCEITGPHPGPPPATFLAHVEGGKETDTAAKAADGRAA